MLLVAIAMVLAGCTPASVAPGLTAQPATPNRPTRIVVYEFASSASEVTQNQSIFQRAYRAVAASDEQQDQDRLRIGRDTAKDLADALVKRLAKLGFNAEQLPRGTPPPDGALAVDGQFLSIDEGNRLRRLVIGLGAGASKLESEVNVYQVVDGEPRQLLDFKTHAESAKMPGAALTMGVGAAAQGGTAAMGAANVGMAGVKTYRSTIGSLADSTAKQIVAYFSQYAANQGWLSQDQVQKAKVENVDQNAQ